jgi:hypothetical protein
MQTLKKIAGYTLAILATPVVLATFMGLNTWPQKLADVTGVQVSAWYTGGEVVRTVAREGYEVRIHRPVFDGFLWDRSEGFVQIELAPLESVPPLVTEDIDFDNDGARDFRLELDKQKLAAGLTDQTERVLGLEGPYKLRNSYAVRVQLRNR